MLRSLAALLLVALCALPARAQSTISATVVGVPALLSSPYVADLKGDYDAQRFMMLVSVAGADPVTAAFRLRLRRNGRVLLDVTSQPVTFSPGTTSYRTFGDEPSIEFGISADKVIERFPAAERAAILQSGALPEGSYTVDIEPIPAGNAFATPTSTPFEVQWPDPPQLTAPVRGEEVTTMPVFAWTPVVMQAGAAMLSYRLRIVEMLPGQNPVRALASNRPILDETLVGQTTFPYTPDQLPLERGKRYAWSVIASADARMPLRNGGASEAETFVYLPAEVAPPDVTPPADETPILADEGGGGTTITPPSYTTPFTVTLPEVRVSGRVRLGLQGGRSVPLADAPVRVSGVVNGQFQPLVIATTDAQGEFDHLPGRSGSCRRRALRRAAHAGGTHGHGAPGAGRPHPGRAESPHRALSERHDGCGSGDAHGADLPSSGNSDRCAHAGDAGKRHGDAAPHGAAPAGVARARPRRRSCRGQTLCDA